MTFVTPSRNLQQRVIIANDYEKIQIPCPSESRHEHAANDAYAGLARRIYIIDESGPHRLPRRDWSIQLQAEEARGCRRALRNGKKHEAPESPPAARPATAPVIIIPRAECTCKMTRTAHISRREL